MLVPTTKEANAGRLRTGFVVSVAAVAVPLVRETVNPAATNSAVDLFIVSPARPVRHRMLHRDEPSDEGLIVRRNTRTLTGPKINSSQVGWLAGIVRAR